MLRFFDDVFTGLIYLFFGAVFIVASGFCFHYYPKVTSIVLALLILSPVIVWLGKRIDKISLVEKPTSTQPQITLWQSFKDGFNKGRQ